MGKFFKWLFLGTIIGASAGLLLYALGFVVELCNCACQIITCDCSGKDAIPAMWSSGAFGSVMLFCTIGGCVIGAIYGAALGIQEYNVKREAEAAARAKSALEQRQKYAAELKSDLQKKLQSAYTAQNNAKNFDFSSGYSSDSMQHRGWIELNEVENLNEDLKAIIEEAKNEKEGQ